MRRRRLELGLLLLMVGPLALGGVQPVAEPKPGPPPASSAAPSKPEDRTQYWLGVIDLANPQMPEMTLVFSLAFDQAAGTWSGTLDVPPAPGVGGAAAMPLREVAVTDTSMRLISPAPEGNENIFELDRSTPPGGPERAEGRMVAGGVEAFRVRLRRVSKSEASAFIVDRPQMPRPPFPYRDIAAQFTTPAGVTLGGSLSMPEGTGPFPVAVLVGDTGPHDRDQQEALHRPFLVLADHLARRGVAVLRLDDRGVGASTGLHESSTLQELAADVGAALEYVRAQPGVDAGKVGLIGLGQGAVVAPMAAAEAGEKGIAFLVVLSPQGLAGADVLAMQDRRQLEAQGEAGAEVTERTEARRKILKLVASGADEAACIAAIREDLRAGAAAHRYDGGEPSAAQIDEMAEGQYMALTLPRRRSWLSQDPVEALEKVRCPALAVAGEMDLLVTTADNFPKVEGALRASPSGDVTARVFPRLNHQLQPCTTGFPDEPRQITITIAPEVLSLVGEWVRDHTGARK